MRGADQGTVSLKTLELCPKPFQYFVTLQISSAQTCYLQLDHFKEHVVSVNLYALFCGALTTPLEYYNYH